ncbi:exodeoxyribonuclease V subunit alpha [Nocardioides sp. AE5]|uniref:exodeoxyribonuclease V subunit alpha n=1 Tax=Nocardioides sp. AE5 TaxID=2962573 RepID=UPI0028819077|nr:exodeoxyribonuclease V subunit alpha [Nocardioides sp. AE5]MDT0202526.1 exodeoxyribonuclease V subunit alpha [Nocardioides sp. AE5]
MTAIPAEVPDEYAVDQVLGATGLLARLNRAGVVEAADVHVALRAGALCEEADDHVLLALALTVRALRAGSTCLDLGEATAELAELEADGPEVDLAAWRERIAASPLAGEPAVIHVEGDLVFLDRYWREEVQVCRDLLARMALPDDPVDPERLQAGLDRLFPTTGWEEQRAATAIAVNQRTTVLTGGPGTGKTSSVAAVLAVLAEHVAAQSGRPLRAALAAPTGKAAARLSESVSATMGHWPEGAAADRERLAGLEPMTLHRLLGSRPDTRARFRHDRNNRLAYDVVVVDESSMLSLTMMARLLEALRPETRLLLVGDPSQLASIDAGAVLSDLVAGLADRDDVEIAALETSHRFGPRIGALAESIRVGDSDACLAALRSGADEVDFVEDDDVEAALREHLLEGALSLRAAAAVGDGERALALLERHRLLCAHRDGSRGVAWWNRLVERWIGEATGEPIWDEWYVGRPVLVTANDYGLGVFNGDTGVTVRRGGELRVLIRAAGAGGAVRDLAPSRLTDVQTMHAMTIHKSQGSQAREVTVLMPDEESRLLTRELFYTAVTRAEQTVRVVGSEAVLREALARNVRRASGLRERLRRVV